MTANNYYAAYNQGKTHQRQENNEALHSLYRKLLSDELYQRTAADDAAAQGDIYTADELRAIAGRTAEIAAMLLELIR